MHPHTQISLWTILKENSFTHLSTFSLIYLRFIDDIFFKWTGSRTDLENFLDKLNAKHASIKFGYEISKERISFLDTEIYI